MQPLLQKQGATTYRVSFPSLMILTGCITAPTPQEDALVSTFPTRISSAALVSQLCIAQLAGAQQTPSAATTGGRGRGDAGAGEKKCRRGDCHHRNAYSAQGPDHPCSHLSDQPNGNTGKWTGFDQ